MGIENAPDVAIYFAFNYSWIFQMLFNPVGSPTTYFQELTIPS